eukprot:305077-Pleurochrysis_carterae.AAC.1
MDAPHTTVVTTDASGVDGVGGYSFRTGRTGPVAWLVSEPWPRDVREALRRGAATAAERETERRSSNSAHQATLSMPTAELFGAWAVAAAVSDATAEPPTAVIAVGDCDPAAAALNA